MRLPTFLLLALAPALLGAATPSGLTDLLVFGDAASEQAHRFAGPETKATVAALGEPARVSLPKTPPDYYGGDLTFTLKVDPQAQNYFTVKFWGSDVNGGQKALLYLEGEQLGYRHLGDYEALNHGAGEPSFPERFFYATAVLPLAVTRGRGEVTITIRTLGPISGYALGGGYDDYQKRMNAPSRGYYRAYSHTSAALAGLAAERQGAAPSSPPVRPAFMLEPPPANRAPARLQEALQKTGVMPPREIEDFARIAAEVLPGSNPELREKVIAQLVAKIDAQAANAYEPTFFAKGVYQGDWGGSFASVAAAIFSMNQFVAPEEWASLLAETISVHGETQTRRDAWTRMIKGNFDYARTHIARITNQAMFCLHGAYRSNRALQIINPAVAEPEETGKRFLFEAAGLAPYRGNDRLDAAGKLIGREDPFGEHYLQITARGLTREFTYVAIYGEIANDLVNYWELYGYDALLKQALLSAHARAQMKYSDRDEQGFRALRMEGVIESRGPAYPDDVGYVQRRRGFTMVRAARLMAEHPEKYAGADWAPYWKMEREIVGYAQQMLADGQRPEIHDMASWADYDFIRKQPPTGILLPNTNLAWYQPAEIQALTAAGLDVSELQRHAWADEDNGTISLRDGDLTLFVGLVMKANWGVNGLARVHCLTSTIDRLATLVPEVQFDWSGKWSVRPDWTNVQFMNANNAPERPFQVLAGEVLPFASQPAVQPTAEVDNPYVGYANFYSLRYLKYLIGMNTTRAVYGNARSYQLKLPANFSGTRVFDFITRRELPVADGAVEVGPQSTVILEMPDEADPAPRPMASRLAAAFAGAEGVTVRWSPAGGATGYLIKRAAAHDAKFSEIGRVPAAATAFVDAQAPAGARYTVAALNEHGTGLDAPATGVIPPDPALLAWLAWAPGDPAAAPGAVRELRGENIKQRVDLRWQVARRGATYNVLRASQAAGPFTPVATGLELTEWTDPEVRYGETYAYAVVALNRAGLPGPPAPPVLFSPVDDTIPPPWQGTDLGEVGTPGFDGLRDGVFSIRGSGADIWGARDAGHFIYQTLEGDGSVVARLTSQAVASAKSGPMFRESLDPGARNIFLFPFADGALVCQARSERDTSEKRDHHGYSARPWLKLTRTGNDFIAAASADGRTWTEIQRVTLALPAKIYVGLAVTAHARGTLNLATFEQVAVVKP